ncbi:MAG: hypothetical protein Phog2KO_22000 [Phototrophicaceae bacterium]
MNSEIQSIDREEQTIIRPISRKYLRYLVEALNDYDSGRGTFARLVTSLIHRRKCSNILPATEPSSGGDLGQDARTHDVYLFESSNLFRLYESPPETPERWIFAFSIAKDWEDKLEKDVQKILKNNLHPDRIIFVTNQFISPEKRKITIERNIENIHSVSFEILDGQWIVDQLYNYDYVLAVEYLECPPENDPQLAEMFQRIFGLKETGLSEDEGAQVEQLKQQLQYRNKYADNMNHFIQDLNHIGNILVKYDKHLEESIQWYEEGLSIVDELDYKIDGIQLYYDYFKALFKLPHGITRILELLPKFIDMVFDAKNTDLYGYIQNWLFFAFGKSPENEELRELFKQTRERFETINIDHLGVVNIAHVDEIIVIFDLFMSQVGLHERQDTLDSLFLFLKRIESLHFYPVEGIAKTLGAVAVWMTGNEQFEKCYEFALEIESKQHGKFQKAQSLAKRAVYHADAKQYEEAIKIGLRAKQLWFSDDTIRGFLLACMSISEWYKEIGYFAVAELELYEGLHVAYWNTAKAESDLFVKMLLSLYGISLKQGKPLQGFKWLWYFYVVSNEKRIIPNAEVYENYLLSNGIIILSALYKENREQHDQLLALIDKFGIEDGFTSYKRIIMSSDEEFDKYVDDIDEDGRTEAREMRKMVRSGKQHAPEDFIFYNELASKQFYSFTMPVYIFDQVAIKVEYDSNKESEIVAFTLTSMLQTWLAVAVDEFQKLTFVDQSIIIDIIIDDKRHIITKVMDDETFKLQVTMTHEDGKHMLNGEASQTIEFVATILITLIESIVIDSPDDVKIFSETLEEVIKRHSLLGLPAYIMKETVLIAHMNSNDG